MKEGVGRKEVERKERGKMLILAPDQYGLQFF